MMHRTLLQHPPTTNDLRNLLEELPAQLDSIAASRPALGEEIASTRPYLQRMAAYITTAPVVDEEQVVQGLHRALAPLFAS